MKFDHSDRHLFWRALKFSAQKKWTVRWRDYGAMTCSDVARCSEL